jgi:hypothetical protein
MDKAQRFLPGSTQAVCPFRHRFLQSELKIAAGADKEADTRLTPHGSNSAIQQVPRFASEQNPEIQDTIR